MLPIPCKTGTATAISGTSFAAFLLAPAKRLAKTENANDQIYACRKVIEANSGCRLYNRGRDETSRLAPGHRRIHDRPNHRYLLGRHEGALFPPIRAPGKSGQ